MAPSVYLTRCQVFGVSPFGDAEFPFLDTTGEPRLMTVVHGAGGVGKTALLQVLGCTRPGNATVLVGRGLMGRPVPPFAACEWSLGDDDVARPHPLTVLTPNARTEFASRPMGAEWAEDQTALRRREQALYDRQAKEGTGFVFVSISAARWFSRQAVSLHAPVRSVASYDVRTSGNLHDASASDLTRETKQALAYAAIGAALMPNDQRSRVALRQAVGSVHDMRLLGNAMQDVVDSLLRPAGLRYEGLDPMTIEPTFSSPGGRRMSFGELPTSARHLICFGALPIRSLWAAYPGRDPRTAQGVVTIDEADLHQDGGVVDQLVDVLRSTLPRVQWILTSTSARMAASVPRTDVVALRRLGEDEHIELFFGDQASTH